MGVEKGLVVMGQSQRSDIQDHRRDPTSNAAMEEEELA